jgi:large subunit ribosomal protein L19
MNTNIAKQVALGLAEVEARKQLAVRTGDTVRVWVRILEDAAKKKYRLQAFEGLVIATKHGTTNGASLTVRRTASGVGVERVFPLFSPAIGKIEIVKRSEVRRAKLYYIREKSVRDARRKMKQTKMSKESSADFAAEETSTDAAA